MKALVIKHSSRGTTSTTSLVQNLQEKKKVLTEEMTVEDGSRNEDREEVIKVREKVAEGTVETETEIGQEKVVENNTYAQHDKKKGHSSESEAVGQKINCEVIEIQKEERNLHVPAPRHLSRPRKPQDRLCEYVTNVD